MLEVMHVEDVLKEVAPHAYVLVICTGDADEVVTGTIDVLVPCEVETVWVVTVTTTTVGDAELVVTGADTGLLMVDMLQLGAAASDLGASLLGAAPPYPP